MQGRRTVVGMAKKIIIKKPIAEIPERYKNELNEGQFNAVTHSEGPALIIAGAGSGKTRALTYRVAYLIDNNVPAQSIILVTFTKKAAREMVARVEKLSGNKAHGINAGTFHHIANVVLHRYAKVVGIQNNFSVLDEHDRIVLMKMARTRHVSKEDKKRYPNASLLVEMHSKRVNLALTLKNTIEYYYPEFSEDLEVIERILNDYDTMKRQNNTLHFMSILLIHVNFVKRPHFMLILLKALLNNKQSMY